MTGEYYLQNAVAVPPAAAAAAVQSPGGHAGPLPTTQPAGCRAEHRGPDTKQQAHVINQAPALFIYCLPAQGYHGENDSCDHILIVILICLVLRLNLS